MKGANVSAPTRLLVSGGSAAGLLAKVPMEYFNPDNSSQNGLIPAEGYIREEHVMGVLPNGWVVIAGGKKWVQRAPGLMETEIFDPDSQRLVPGPKLPFHREGLGGAVVGGLFYICGGRNYASRSQSSCLRLHLGRIHINHKNRNW